MSRHRAPSRRDGFTIVEALVSLAIMALIMVAIGFALQNASQSTRSNALVAESRQRSMNGLNYILSQIRRAKDIALVPPGTSAPALQVITSMDAVANPVTWNQISLDGTNLKVTSETGTSDPALSSVTSLNFTCPYESDGVTQRMVTVNMAVRIADPLAPNDPSRSRILNLQATEVARCVPKP